MTLNHTFSDLKKLVPIITVLNDKGLDRNFKKMGGRLFGPCPIHGGDNPNGFVVSISKNQWYCFTQCGRGGDVVELVRSLNKTDYRQAAKYLNSLVDLKSPFPKAASGESCPNVFHPYTLSLPLNNASSFLRKKWIKPLTAKRFEAGEYHGKGFLGTCMGIRLHDLQGFPLGYAGRRLDPDQIIKYGKWKFPKGLPKNRMLYNFHRIRSQIQRGIFIVESPWGVMRLSQLNIPAIALLGLHVSNFQLEILSKVPRIVLMLDGDDAGRKSTERLLKRFKAITNVDYVILPPGYDPDDLHDNTLSEIAKFFFS